MPSFYPTYSQTSTYHTGGEVAVDALREMVDSLLTAYCRDNEIDLDDYFDELRHGDKVHGHMDQIYTDLVAYLDDMLTEFSESIRCDLVVTIATMARANPPSSPTGVPT